VRTGRGAPLILATVLVFLAILLVPDGPVSLADATHDGDIVCPGGPDPEHDGALARGEYTESFFDPKTKILIYFTCLEDPDRTMHLGLVSPGDQWTEVRFQATDVWNGVFNVVRVAPTGPSGEAIDGFLDGAETGFVEDSSVGGTHDVEDLFSARRGDHYVHEFAIPLLSADPFDSQLTVNGSFAFQLVYRDGAQVAESETRFLQIGQLPAEGQWTTLELSLPEGNEPAEPVEVIVTLRDNRSRPLAFRPISVFVQTAFGFLDLGNELTSEQGIASFEYAPLGGETYLIGAAFEGERGHLASVVWLQLVLTPATPDLSLFPRDVLIVQAVIVLVVGGIWASYVYSLVILRQVLRPPKGERLDPATRRGEGSGEE
jgi:hypothetical protein